MRRLAPVVLSLLLFAACASTPKVDMKEPRRLVATDNDVRFDVQVRGEMLGPSNDIPLDYEVTNNRDTAIAIAELVPDATYDPETQTVTINVGSEVPGQQFLPRLVLIKPGEHKTFSVGARVNLPITELVDQNPFHRYPNGLRIRLNFLGDATPFMKLVGISERAVHDPALANELFPKWVEQNESVITSVLPMRWIGTPATNSGDVPIGPVRRRRP
ncbi:MAG TPA: hypothetical protein VGR95_02730 [Thermoanaerobaculia bacterium]|nr:hypothetical protein [Thermoanaerobaculia bacterium]